MSVKSRHEPVPQPEGQSASLPNLAQTVFPGRGRHVPAPAGGASGLVFLLCAPSFSSLFFRFSVLVSRVLSRSKGCAVATPAIRGVSRGGCATSPCSGKVHPDSRGQWHQEHRAPTQEPRILQVSPYVRGTLMAVAVFIYYWWDIYVLGLRFLAQPAVTSANEVLTQTHVARLRWSLLRCSAFSVRKSVSKKQENRDSPPGSR